MINTDNQHLLMIEPIGAPSATPVIDDMTRRMASALNSAIRGTSGRPGNSYRGTHSCTGAGCRAGSDNQDHTVATIHPPWNLVTNSLAVHYLAYHRDEVPAEELAKVRSLSAPATADPTALQLNGHTSIAALFRDAEARPKVDRDPVRRIMTAHGATPRDGVHQMSCDCGSPTAAAIVADLTSRGYRAAAAGRGVLVDLWDAPVTRRELTR